MHTPPPSAPQPLTLPGLDGVGPHGLRVRHGFFTRVGGVSQGLYAGLNVGLGSNDARDAVGENRHRVAAALGVPDEALTTVHQVHSPDVVTITQPHRPADAPRADALVTCRPGLALGVLTADCVPVLFSDGEAGVIGAAHAGWKGAFTGVLEATVDAMGTLGARVGRVVAGIGPHIGRDSYEVGPEFLERFIEQAPENARYFRPSPRAGHHWFAIGDYVADRLARAGVARVERCDQDTLTQEALFYSYRRATLRGEADYGRQISAITLVP